MALLQGFNGELGSQRLLARGVSPQVLKPLQIEDVNLAGSRARGAQLLFLVPWLALVGAVVGAISVAIDVTAGERERGSLEPLLMNPVATGSLVLGKWAVAATCSAAVVVLTLAGFTAAMQFVRSENLAALMQFGLPEVAAVHRAAAAVFGHGGLAQHAGGNLRPQPQGSADLRELYHDAGELRADPAAVPDHPRCTVAALRTSAGPADRADARAARRSRLDRRTSPCRRQ